MDIELRNARVYEIGYLFLPALGTDGVAEAVGEIKSKLAEMGAEHISEGEAQHIDLAYEMIKVIDNQNHFLNTGYFGWLKFSINPEAIADITDMLDASPSMLRYLLSKTSREDTMMNAKPMASAEVVTPDSYKITTPDEVVEKKEETVKEAPEETTEAPAEDVAEEEKEEEATEA